MNNFLSRWNSGFLEIFQKPPSGHSKPPSDSCY